MRSSKIRLSPAEMELFTNAEIILTKNTILQKTAAVLNEVQEALTTETDTTALYASPPPKISKGENYLGLPYLILDYPRIASGPDLFFIRSMFWWGHFFSSTLQLSGTFAERFREHSNNAYSLLHKQSYFVGINQDPWVHHFGEDNYKEIGSISSKTFDTILEEVPHIKIAASWPLSEWDVAANKLQESWRLLKSLVP